ncbi:MAG: methyltransferase domain-containing protein [Pseudomonadota bacterium]
MVFDRRLLAHRRHRFAMVAADHDFLLQRVADDFFERLAIIKREFPVGVNLGAHHGVLTPVLGELPNVGRIIDVDGVWPLLCQSGGGDRLRVLADEEALPFADGSLDLVVSGLSLHHVNDLPGCFVQIRRALKPDGLFLGAILGGRTLEELRMAWLRAEAELTGGSSPRVAPFGDVRDFGGLLQRAGFGLPVVDSDVVTVTYETPFALMAEIKAMGASNALAERRRVPVTRRLMQRAAEIYAEEFSQSDGRVRATFEILTLTAWSPHDSQQKPLKPGSAAARLADALGTIEQPAGDKAGGGT